MTWLAIMALGVWCWLNTKQDAFLLDRMDDHDHQLARRILRQETKP